MLCYFMGESLKMEQGVYGGRGWKEAGKSKIQR